MNVYLQWSDGERHGSKNLLIWKYFRSESMLAADGRTMMKELSARYPERIFRLLRAGRETAEGER